MALGAPTTGTGSAWYSQFETDVQNLLQRLQDNSSQTIDAKDVRDTVWTLYNQVQTVASQSVTQSSTYRSQTQSTVTVGGLLRGATYSGLDFGQMFLTMLTPYVAPTINTLSASPTEYQFGQNSVVTLSYDITPGSSPLFSIDFVGPWQAITSNLPTGSDPEVGTKGLIAPTYSISANLLEHNIFTMSVVTTDTLTFSSTASIVYKHKKYYGPLIIPGGFTSSDPTSVAAVAAYITDARIKSLTYSTLDTDHALGKAIDFATGSYFIYAAPEVFGDLDGDGFIINGMSSNAYTKVRISSTFSNEYSYLTPYNVWVSNYSLGSSRVKIVHQ